MEVNLIVAALKEEVRLLLAKMAVECTLHLKPALLYRGKIFNSDIDLLITGMGARRMEEGLEAALALGHPKSILLVGCAGGTSPAVKTGCLVLAEELISANGGGCFKPDREMLERAKELCEKEGSPFQIGKLVMVHRVIADPHEKADIGATYSALALDMESAAFAKVAEEKKIRWLVVKSILDPMEEMLPPLEDCLEATGEPRPLKLAEHLLKNPKEILQLPKVQQWVSEARDSIAKFLEGWMVQ